MEIQDEAYQEIGHDSLEVFADKLSVYPQGCFAAVVDGRLAGYLFSHPWTCMRATRLDAPLVLPTAPDCYYLHDLAIANWAHGRGAARRLVEAALYLARAEGLSRQGLVAVQNSEPFWGRFGFARVIPDEMLRRKLLGYSKEACYMLREEAA